MSFVGVLIAAAAQGVEPEPREPLFRVDGAFLDAAVRKEHLYLLADEVAPGEPDVLVLQLGADRVEGQVGRYTALHPPLALSGAAGWLFLAEGDRGLEVVDVREPANPRRAAHLPLAGYSHQVVPRDGTALVAAGFGGLHLLDIRDPARPSLLSSYQAYPPPPDAREDPPESLLPMAGPSEESGYFRADDLPAYEGTEEQVTAHDIRDREGALDLAVEGAIAYLAYASAGVVIVDISDSSKPRRIGGYQTERAAERIAVQNGRAYVTVGVQGLLILDVTDPARPQLLGRIRTRCYPMGVAEKDSFVYLADGLCGEKGLLVIDVRDPAAPRVVGRLPGRIGNVRVLGDRVVSLGVKKARGYALFTP